MPHLSGPYKVTCNSCGWHLIVFRQTPDYINSMKDLPIQVTCQQCGGQTLKSSPSVLELLNPAELLRWWDYCKKHGLER